MEPLRVPERPSALLKPASKTIRLDARKQPLRGYESTDPPGVQPGSQLTVIPGYTQDVKTAISVPDDTFEQASKQAAELGISRSEFFARAARRYLDELAARSLTQQVDDALRAAGSDDSAAAAAQAGRQQLATGDEW